MPGLPPNTLFSVLAFVGFILAIIPLPRHMQLWNMGSSMYMLWSSFGCLILFINSIIWNDNTINSAPVWCDISTHYIIGACVGIPASSFCIIRRLYYISKLQTVSVYEADKKREAIIDVSIGVGLPCVVMALQYIVQSRRFIIYEQAGCYPFITDTQAAYPLFLMWPLLIGSISLVYAVLAFRRAFLQRQRLRSILQEGFSVSSSHYWRLMALCCSEIIFTVPLGLFDIIRTAIMDPPTPYGSWALVHADFSQIPQVPTAVWQSIPEYAISVETERWVFVLCALVIFGFFGCAREVRSLYSDMFWSICRRLACLKLPSTIRETKRTFIHTDEPTLSVYHTDQRTTLRRPSVSFIPAQAERNSSRTSVSACYMDISFASIPTTPEPAFARDRSSFVITQLPDLGSV